MKKKINTNLTMHGEIAGMDSRRRELQTRLGLCEVCNESTRGSTMKYKGDNRIRYRRYCNRHSHLNVAFGQPLYSIHGISVREIEGKLSKAAKAYIRYFIKRFIKAELPPILSINKHEEAIRSLSSSKQHRHITSFRRGYSRDGLLRQMTHQALITLDEDKKYKLIYRLVLTALFSHLDTDKYTKARQAERIRGLNDVRWFLLGKCVLSSLSISTSHQSFKRVSLIGESASSLIEGLIGLLKEAGMRNFEILHQDTPKLSEGMIERFLEAEGIDKLGYYHRQLYLRELMNDIVNQSIRDK